MLDNEEEIQIILFILKKIKIMTVKKFIRFRASDKEIKFIK